MNSRLSPALSEFSEGRWAGEPSFEPPPHPSELALAQSKRSSRRKQIVLTLARFLTVFGIGVAATLTWQSYGDLVRETTARTFPRLAWLAPQPAPAAEDARTLASAAPAQLKAISISLAGVRQSVDKLAAEITKLQATKPDTSDKISPPPPSAPSIPARKPQAPTGR